MFYNHDGYKMKTRLQINPSAYTCNLQPGMGSMKLSIAANKIPVEKYKKNAILDGWC